MIKINLKTNKKCSYCGEIKPLSKFYKNKRQNDGYHFYCKDCAKDIRKKEYKKNKKEISKRQKEYTSKIKQEFFEGKRTQAKKKYCPKCKKIKLAKYFAKDYNNPTGLYVYCSECRRKYWREKRKSKERKYKNKKYLLKQKNKTIQEVATENNCSYATIRNWSKIFNIKLKNANTKNPEDCSLKYYRKGYQENGRNRNKESQKAMSILRQAIKENKIKRNGFCQICNKNGGKISGHHFDYNKPLQVIWVCHSCHRLIHRYNLDKIENIDILKNKLKI